MACVLKIHQLDKLFATPNFSIDVILKCLKVGFFVYRKKPKFTGHEGIFLSKIYDLANILNVKYSIYFTRILARSYILDTKISACPVNFGFFCRSETI